MDRAGEMRSSLLLLLVLLAGLLSPACCWMADTPLGYLVSSSMLINGSITVIDSTNTQVDLYSLAQQQEAQIVGLQSAVSSLQASVTALQTLTSSLLSTLSQQAASLQSTQSLLALQPAVTTWLGGSGTWTAPSNPALLFIRVRMIGGGGGGSGAPAGYSTAASGGNGNFSMFGPLVADGGQGGQTSYTGNEGGYGGAAFTTGSVSGSWWSQPGSRGEGGLLFDNGADNLNVHFPGGVGGSSFMSGGGFSATGSFSNGQFGSGGAGGCATEEWNSGTGFSGAGGGAGAYVEALLYSPSGSYSWSVGAGGSYGPDNQDGFGCTGTEGGAGIIVLEQYYH